MAALRQDAETEPAARKLLSFTDNRQDASLQAGHLNDFVQVALLRGCGDSRVAVAVMTTGQGTHRYGKRTLEGVFRRLLRGLFAQ